MRPRSPSYHSLIGVAKLRVYVPVDLWCKHGRVESSFGEVSTPGERSDDKVSILILRVTILCKDVAYLPFLVSILFIVLF